jgi:hypothetical protein
MEKNGEGIMEKIVLDDGTWEVLPISRIDEMERVKLPGQSKGRVANLTSKGRVVSYGYESCVHINDLKDSGILLLKPFESSFTTLSDLELDALAAKEIMGMEVRDLAIYTKDNDLIPVAHLHGYDGVYRRTKLWSPTTITDQLTDCYNTLRHSGKTYPALFRFVVDAELERVLKADRGEDYADADKSCAIIEFPTAFLRAMLRAKGVNC